MTGLQFAAAVILAITLVQRQTRGETTAACSLTDTQTQKSIDAFAKIAAFVTTEPRCVNCHGGVNPYIADIGLDPDDQTAAVSTFVHGGGRILRQREQLNGTNIVEQECRDCHDHMAKKRDGSDSLWSNAANFHSFVDKDATTLCKQFKQSSRDANDFIGHVTDDNGGSNFAQTAFNGDRGLDPDRYGALITPPQVPSLTKPQFLKLVHDWIDAMGGQFSGDAGCGCEFRHATWSGQIHYVYNVKGDEGKNEAQNWSNSVLFRITITVKDGVGTATSHGVEKHEAENRQPKFGGGYIRTDSENVSGSASGSSPAQVDVRIDERTGMYSISASFVPVTGKMEGTSCLRDDCKPVQQQLTVVMPRSTAISEKVGDRNHIQGSKFDKQTGIGRAHNGVMITSITWDLSRSGG